MRVSNGWLQSTFLSKSIMVKTSFNGLEHLGLLILTPLFIDPVFICYLVEAWIPSDDDSGNRYVVYIINFGQGLIAILL